VQISSFRDQGSVEDVLVECSEGVVKGKWQCLGKGREGKGRDVIVAVVEESSHELAVVGVIVIVFVEQTSHKHARC
jgi:hypothetical protein